MDVADEHPRGTAAGGDPSAGHPAHGEQVVPGEQLESGSPVVPGDKAVPGDQAVTGDQAVDGALAALEDLAGRPVREHVAVFEAVHGALSDRLAETRE